jgi:hypothetical protein
MGLDSWTYGSVALFLREDNNLGKSQSFIWAYIKRGNVSYIPSVPEIVGNFFRRAKEKKTLTLTCHYRSEEGRYVQQCSIKADRECCIMQRYCFMRTALLFELRTDVQIGCSNFDQESWCQQGHAVAATFICPRSKLGSQPNLS